VRYENVNSDRVPLFSGLNVMIYLQSIGFKDFTVRKERDNAPNLMSSFDEAKALKIARSRQTAKDFVDMNRNHLARIYPLGTRIDSSNYEPTELWAVGCQLVALNYQKPGKPIFRNYGKFLENGQCGYVLKPAALQKGSAFTGVFDPTNLTKLSVIPSSTVRSMTVQIFSARQLPRSKKGSIINPSVQVSVAGVINDNAEYDTKVIKQNGFNPYWNETFAFKFVMSELAIFLITILDNKKIIKSKSNTTQQKKRRRKKIAFYSLPVECIQPGYRIVHLLDKNAKPIPMCDLFCKFTIHKRKTSHNT